MNSTATIDNAHDYALSSDLAKLCLPQEFRDSNRRLAWVNSICFLFLLVGLIGVKPPRIVERPIKPPLDIVPVVFTPPPEQPKTEPDQKPEPTEQPQTTMADMPQIATVVAADSANVAFAVPVKGPVTLVPARYAPPPPAVLPSSAPKPRIFIPGHGEGGTFPWPSGQDYPREALMQRAQGTVTLSTVVDTNGVPIQVDIKTSSGHYSLDRASAQWVKEHWRWLPGETRYYYVPFVWQLQ
jgi:periplasmic protein TonB